MYVHGGVLAADVTADSRSAGGRDIAVVVAEFGAVDSAQAVKLAGLLFAFPEVLTVRIGAAGERSVFRVDVPRGNPAASDLGIALAKRTAQALDIGLHIVRVNITRDGRGDPEGDPLPEGAAVPWSLGRFPAATQNHVKKSGYEGVQ